MYGKSLPGVLLSTALAATTSPGIAAAGDVTAEGMVLAAQRLLADLDEEQRSQAVFDLDADERFDWHFIPKRDRKGLPLKAMQSAQVHLTHVLLNESLSRIGYSKAATIMSLEAVLREIEGRRGSSPFLELRDPMLYFVSFFGEPRPEESWAWSIEGHHVSLNFTVVDGVVASSPTFLGANPHEVLEGPRKGLRVLGREEDLGRAMLASLNEEQRQMAVLASQAPRDIFTSADREVEFESPPQGISAAQMDDAQQAALRALIECFVENVPADLAARRRAQYEGSDFAKIRFAWLGSTTAGPGNGHYFRVQAPTFLIEYDNVQGNANHSHTVWRDYEGDFGRDLLAEHHETHEH